MFNKHYTLYIYTVVGECKSFSARENIKENSDL